MAPRRATPAAAAAGPLPDFIGEDATDPNYVGTQSVPEVPSAYGVQEPRTDRHLHTLKTTNISKSGNTPIYKFSDVLNFAYTQGFLGFGPPDITFHPGMGHSSGTLCVVVASGAFRNAAGEVETFFAIGDASPENCGTMVKPHYPRMAETRAQGRLLNRALNLNAVMAEELFEEEPTASLPIKVQTSITQGVTASRTPTVSNGGGLSKFQKSTMPEYWPAFNNIDGDGFSCDTCEKPVEGKSAFWSVDKTGNIYCWEHQQENIKK